VNHSMDGFKDGFDKEKLATYERKHNDNEQGKIANWLAYITTHPQQPGPPDPTAFVETPVPSPSSCAAPAFTTFTSFYTVVVSRNKYSSEKAFTPYDVSRRPLNWARLTEYIKVLSATFSLISFLLTCAI